jgi:hypothetical protein
MAASALRTSKTYLGAQFRHLRSRLDTPVAIKAMAAKLARLVYRILRYGMKYVDRGAAFYEAQHRQQQIKHLKSKPPSLDSKSSKFRQLKKPRSSSFWRGVSGETGRRRLYGALPSVLAHLLSST